MLCRRAARRVSKECRQAPPRSHPARAPAVTGSGSKLVAACIFPGTRSALNFFGMSAVRCGMWRSPITRTSTWTSIKGRRCVKAEGFKCVARAWARLGPTIAPANSRAHLAGGQQRTQGCDKRQVKRADKAANNHRRSVSQTDTGTGYPGSPSRGEVGRQRSRKVRLGAAKHLQDSGFLGGGV